MSSSYTARLRRVQQYVNGNELGQPVDTNEGSVTAMKRVACNNCVSSELLGPFSSGPRVMNTAAVIDSKVNRNGVDPVVKLSPYDTTGKASIRTMNVRCLENAECQAVTFGGLKPGELWGSPSGNTCATGACDVVKDMNVQPASARTTGARQRTVLQSLGPGLFWGEPGANAAWQRPTQASRDTCYKAREEGERRVS